MFKNKSITDNGRYLSLKDEYLEKLTEYCKDDSELMMFLTTRIFKNEDGEFLCDENKAKLAEIKAFIPDLPLVNSIKSEIERLEDIKLKDLNSWDSIYLEIYKNLMKYVQEHNYNFLVWNIVNTILDYEHRRFYNQKSTHEFQICKKLYTTFTLSHLLDNDTAKKLELICGGNFYA